MATLGVIKRWALRENMSIREIARCAGLARNTVKKYLAAGVEEPRYAKRVSPSKLAPYAEKLSMWLQMEVTKSRKHRRNLRQIHTRYQLKRHSPMKFDNIRHILDIERDSFDQALSVLEDNFGRRWLDTNNTHRVAQVWQRKDALAALELYSLGSSIENLFSIDSKRAIELIKAAKKGGKTSHGFLFEIQVIAALVRGQHEVQPTPKAAAGCDAIVQISSQLQYRISIKNHDQSDHEAIFRSRCLDIYEKFRAISKAGALDRLLIVSEQYLEKSDFNYISDSISVIAKGSPHLDMPHVKLVRTRNNAAEGDPGYSPAFLSTQLIVIAGQHKNEQKKFIGNLRDAANNMSKHCPRREGYANIIMMRVHATADMQNLVSIAKRLVYEENSSVDSVILVQPSIARNVDRSQPILHIQGVFGPKHPVAPTLNLHLPVGIFSGTAPPTVLNTDGNIIPLIQKYLFQKGEITREATLVDDGFQGFSKSVGDGIVEKFACQMHGKHIIIGMPHPPSDELLLI